MMMTVIKNEMLRINYSIMRLKGWRCFLLSIRMFQGQSFYSNVFFFGKKDKFDSKDMKNNGIALFPYRFWRSITSIDNSTNFIVRYFFFGLMNQLAVNGYNKYSHSGLGIIHKKNIRDYGWTDFLNTDILLHEGKEIVILSTKQTRKLNR